MTTRTQIVTAGFLGLSSLFAAQSAIAEHKPLKAGPGDARISFDLGNRGGVSISVGNNLRYDGGRRWIPERYEERHVQVLVEKGHYHDVHKQVLVHAGHWEEKHTQVLVHAGHYEKRWVAPVYRTVVHRDGCRENVLVRPGYYDNVWCPPKYETRCEKIWCPPKYETVCEKVWVPDRYETRCEKVLVPGRWEYVGGGHDHDDHDHGRNDRFPGNGRQARR